MQSPYAIEPFGRHHDRTAFSCGELALDRYLKQQASQDVARSTAAIFVMCPTGTNRVIGYYTLSASSVDVDDFPLGVARKLPKYSIPVTLIGRLAVDLSYQDQRFGKTLLFNALRRAFIQRVHIGSAAVIVDAKHETARTFYERHGFRQLTSNPYRLFMTMKTIEQILPANTL